MNVNNESVNFNGIILHQKNNDAIEGSDGNKKAPEDKPLI